MQKNLPEPSSHSPSARLPRRALRRALDIHPPSHKSPTAKPSITNHQSPVSKTTCIQTIKRRVPETPGLADTPLLAPPPSPPPSTAEALKTTMSTRPLLPTICATGMRRVRKALVPPRPISNHISMCATYAPLGMLLGWRVGRACVNALALCHTVRLTIWSKVP